MPQGSYTFFFSKQISDLLQLRTEKQRSFLNTLLKYYCEDCDKSPSPRLIQEVCPHAPWLLCLYPQGVCHDTGVLQKVSAVSSALTVLKRTCTSRKIQVLLTWVQGLYLLEWCQSDISANPASHRSQLAKCKERSQRQEQQAVCVRKRKGDNWWEISDFQEAQKN